MLDGVRGCICEWCTFVFADHGIGCGSDSATTEDTTVGTNAFSMCRVW